MHWIRIAYSTQYIISLAAFYLLWGEVGGSGHLDLMPWYLKLALGITFSYSFVKATAAAASQDQAWNGSTLRWTGILLSIVFACGLVTYYYHVYEEDTGDEDEDAVTEVQPCRRNSRPAAPVNASHPRRSVLRG